VGAVGVQVPEDDGEGVGADGVVAVGGVLQNFPVAVGFVADGIGADDGDALAYGGLVGSVSNPVEAACVEAVEDLELPSVRPD